MTNIDEQSLEAAPVLALSVGNAFLSIADILLTRCLQLLVGCLCTKFVDKQGQT